MKPTPYLYLELFTRVQSDIEARQYRILAGLKRYREHFRINEIYPYLSHLVELYRTLDDIQARLQDLRGEFPKKIINIDLVNREIKQEAVFSDGADLSNVEDLIEWSLPQMENVIHEGTVIHDYVEEELLVEHVGIVPNYREEGYFFVPDRSSNRLKLFQFEVSIFKSAEDRYRSLKTDFVKSIAIGGVALSPNSIKLELIREQKKMPNPATYYVETRLDFPFRETILPVTKRKLMQTISN